METTCFYVLSSIADTLYRSGHIGTSRTYAATLRSLKRFRQGVDLPISSLTSEEIGRYEAYLMASGVCRNTSSMYMRCLRAAYRRVKYDTAPFRHVYTGVDKTTKRALPLAVIRQVRSLCLATDSTIAWARDLFLFSLYTRGMPFVDMAFLRKSDLAGETLSYRRRKTGQLLSVHWEPCMQDILYLHPSTTRYLLPIITHEDGTERTQYENVLHLVNAKLKRVATLVGAPTPFSFYAARHSWGTLAKARGIPLSVISDALGHDSETTTRIYLASLSPDIIDEANRLIISML